MSDIDISALGYPVPCSWRVEQVRKELLTGFVMYVKLTQVTPTGLHITFHDGDEALGMAAALKRAGNACQAGLWASALPNEPKGSNLPEDPISGSTQGSVG